MFQRQIPMKQSWPLTQLGEGKIWAYILLSWTYKKTLSDCRKLIKSKTSIHYSNHRRVHSVPCVFSLHYGHSLPIRTFIFLPCTCLLNWICPKITNLFGLRQLPWLRGVCPHKHCPLCQHNQYLIELEHRVGTIQPTTCIMLCKYCVYTRHTLNNNNFHG